MTIVLEKIDSTQSELKRRLSLDPALPNFFSIQALEQTDGRGRQGRVWSSSKGNLFLSVLLRGPLDHITWIPHRVAVAMLQSLQELGLTDPRLKLKWPNDLVIDHETPQKMAGLIIEKIGEHFVVGVGVNVAKAPVVAQQNTTCVAFFLPQLTTEQLRDRFLEKLQNPYQLSRLKELYRKHLLFQGGETVWWGDELGVFEKIGEYGEMIVRLNSQATKALFSDDVHLTKTKF